MEDKKIFIKERILQIAKAKKISYESFFEVCRMGTLKEKPKAVR